jgi:threonine aldolase
MSDEQSVSARACRSLSYDRPDRPSDRLRTLAAFAEAEGLDAYDSYGRGAPFERLEAELVRIFGLEAAVFMPTGRLCQLVALKIHAERRGIARVALHPKSHLEVYERRAHEIAGGIAGIPLGHYARLPTVGDIEAIPDRIAAVVLELPMLELACRLPAWDELAAISAHCRSRGIALHADGARLWEAIPFYGRPHGEVAALFDSLYVSFYKGLNAMAGGALLGDGAFVRHARVWQDRFGGVVPRVHPILLDAYRGLRETLGAVPVHHARAQSLARALASVEGVTIVPDPPHTNTFWVVLPGTEAGLRRAAEQVRIEQGITTVHFVRDPGLPGLIAPQIVVGPATLEVSDEEAARAFERLRDLTADR